MAASTVKKTLNGQPIKREKIAITVSTRSKRKDFKESLLHALFFCCGLVSVLTTLGIVLVIGIEAVPFFFEVSIVDFLFDSQWTPLFYDKHFGIGPLVCGTLLIAFIALCVALPLGLTVAIYLSEYASDRVRAVVKPILEVLAGIPTVVYGYFALLFITPILQEFLPDMGGFNALSPGIVMGIMILPMVASLSEDAIYSVPTSLKQGAYALGANRLQTIFTVLVPAAAGGIIASFILAMSRAVGETMIVTIAAGQQPQITLDPTESVATMTAFIVQVSLGDTPHGTLEYRTLFAVGATLFLMTLSLNSVSLWIRGRYQRHGQGG